MADVGRQTVVWQVYADRRKLRLSVAAALMVEINQMAIVKQLMKIVEERE